MDSREFRIGNWVRREDGWNEKVEYIDERGINPIINEYPEFLYQFYPIPIDESVLLRCGFENDSYANFSRKISEHAYIVIHFKDYALCEIRENPTIADHDLNAPCKYLHQLQNLVWVLTGEELEVKEL